jgi:DNA helicase-2/ATP-dependent DNA helicase PcrA
MAVRAETERDQSRFVIKCIEELKYHGLPLNEISVLFRAGFHSFDLESELTRSGFPFVKFGGMKFMEAGHIKDVLAHLKVIANFQDHLSWIRIFKLLPGVGPKKAMKLAASICENGIPENPARHAEAKFRNEFISLIELLKEIRSSESATLAEKIDKVNKHYFPFLQQKYDNYPKKMRELDQLADMALSYRSLTSFLNDVALEPPDSETTFGEYGAESLVLSTIHSAKGLEWHTVILLWAAEGRLPSPMSIFSPDDLEEERRLLYVATTRAKHNLVITAPRTFFDRTRGVVPVKFSRFFEEIPEDYFRFHNF